MKIAIDFDGTLVSSYEVFTKLYHERHPDRDLPRWLDIKMWDLTDTFDTDLDEVLEIFDIMRKEGHYKYGAPTDTNFYYWLNKLLDDDHELYVLTANPEYTNDLIRYWLDKYGLPGIPIKHVKTLSEKREYDFDVIIDDSYDVYKMIDWNNQETKDKRHMIIYTNPWNTGCKVSRYIHRAMNWENVYQLIKEIEHKELLA